MQHAAALWSDEPGGDGDDRPEGRCQRPVDEVGEDGLDDRVLAVGDVGGRGRFRVVGEERGVAPDVVTGFFTVGRCWPGQWARR